MNDKDLIDMMGIMQTLDESILEDYYLKRIRKMNRRCPSVTGVAGLHMIIVADRGRGRARGLLEYIEDKTDIESVKIVKTVREAREYMEMIVPDLVVFAAMQDDAANYRIPAMIQEVKPTVFPAMYAAQDSYIENEAERNNIHCIGDCVQPTDIFAKMLKRCYRLHLKNITRTGMTEVQAEEEESGWEKFLRWFK